MDYLHQARFGSVFSHDTWLKSLVERVIACMVIILMVIPIVLTALLTRFALGPPIFFKQVRTGANMLPFMLYKFRTMHEIYDSDGSLLPDKARETEISRFMRRVRIDEFPQLFAIASGKMSFIGPRPLLPATIQGMGNLGKLRCLVRPGLSGWAQVNGNSRLSDAQKLALDIWYVDHRSCRLDLLILISTATTLAKGESIDHRRLAAAEAYVEAQYGASMPDNLGKFQ